MQANTFQPICAIFWPRKVVAMMEPPFRFFILRSILSLIHLTLGRRYKIGFLFCGFVSGVNICASEFTDIFFILPCLDDVVLGCLIGAALGFSFRYLMKYCQKHDLIDRQSYVAQYVSLALLTIGVTTMLGSDDLLAAFACGSAFAWDGFFNQQTEESVFSSVIDLLFNIGTFIYVGAWMPFNSFHSPETTLSVWRLIVIAILVLLLRRLPVIIALYKWIPDVKTLREAIFSGHFGPIGIGRFISYVSASFNLR